MISKFTVVLVIATFVAKINSQSCSYEVDVDYFGNDLSTNFIYYPTQDLCCAACTANSQCQAWTYVPSTTACWLKKQIGGQRFASPGRNSGLKQQTTATTTPTTTASTTTKVSKCIGEQNVFYSGNDLRGQANVTNVGDCCNICGFTTGCAAWSYNIEFKYCYLKTAVPSTANKLSINNIFSGYITQ